MVQLTTVSEIFNKLKIELEFLKELFQSIELII